MRPHLCWAASSRQVGKPRHLFTARLRLPRAALQLWGSVTTGTAGLRFRCLHFGASRTLFPQGTDFFSRTARGPLAAQRGHGRSRPLPLTRCQASLTVLCPCPLWTRSPEDAGLRVGGGHRSQACPPPSSPRPSLGAQTVLTGETLSFSRLHVPSALRLVGNTVRPPRV